MSGRETDNNMQDLQLLEAKVGGSVTLQIAHRLGARNPTIRNLRIVLVVLVQGI
jgi:hypothetical protein